MGKTLVIALLGISFIGGFVVLEGQQRTLTPDEQVARYRANERARDIAHVGYMRGQDFLRQRLARREIPFRQVFTGRSSGGAYRCSIAVKLADEPTAELDVISYYGGATHQITATLTADADTQLTASNYREWYSARHLSEEW